MHVGPLDLPAVSDQPRRAIHATLSTRPNNRPVCCRLVIDSFAGRPLPVGAGSFTSAVETIHKRELHEHCEVLASDTLEGRETGTHGGEAAGAYIAGVLRKEKHIVPAAADGDYFQPFPPNSRNILARLTGGDAALSREYVIVGAHYDHVGYGNSRNSRGPIGYIHNGADDNASGTAALLELVDAFNSLDIRPKRSVLFIFWDGEEEGLLGSKYWMTSPTVPLDRIRLVFNIDMIGRLRRTARKSSAHAAHRACVSFSPPRTPIRRWL